MKKKGMTLIESVVTIAILGFIFLLATPLIRSFSKVDKRAKTQKEIDSEFLVINEFIQGKIRASKSNDGSGNYAFTSNDGVELHLQIPISATTTDNIVFAFDDANKELTYSENYGTPETLMENLDKVEFKFEKGIVIYFIDYNIGDYERDEEGNPLDNKKLRDSLRGSASSRIEIQN